MSYLILEVIVGSTLHGVAVKDGMEDLDLMGVAVENAAEIMGFAPRDVWVKRSKPEGVRSEAGDVDRTVYGLRKYLALALKSNPSILLALFAPPSMVRVQTTMGQELQALAPAIVSREAYGPFAGYMRQQCQRLTGERGQMNVTRPELIERYGFDTKYAGHVIRLGLQGIELLRTGRITLPMPVESRQIVLAVRRGEYKLDAVLRMAGDLERQLTAAFQASLLPDKPDYRHVERWMLSVYLDCWQAFSQRQEA